MKTKAIALTLSVVMLLVTVGCLSQNTIAALVTTLGNASAAIAAMEGNTSLATQLKADTAAASAAVLNWQKGTNAQMVVEALGIVQDDLNLIPFAGPYIPLISLALVTVQEIIVIVTSNAPASTQAHIAKVTQRKVSYVGKIPKNATQFKKAWNKVVAANPQLAPAAIQ